MVISTISENLITEKQMNRHIDKFLSIFDTIDFNKIKDHPNILIAVSKECSPPQQELQKTLDKFIIPLWPMEAFAKSMIYDINHNGFSTPESYQTLLHAGR
jgi:hypothetical protein